MSAFSPSVGTWESALRINLSSLYSNSGGGVILGFPELKSVPNASSNFYLSLDSLQSISAPIITIPRGASNLTVQFTDFTETSLITATLPDWEIVLEFRVIEDLNFSNDGAFN